MSYFAHTRDERPETEWEPLLRHLHETAQGAALRGGAFGAGELARQAGLLHDLGKYKPAFQARLRGGPPTDHAAVGAVFARDLGPIGKLLAQAIAGHHTGLKDDLFRDEGRLDDEARFLQAVLASARADGLDLPEAVGLSAGYRWDRELRGFQCALLVRMLFSCLIDADRTAAAAFDDRARGQQDDIAETAPVALLEQALTEHLASLASAEPTRRPISDLRDRVLRHVRGQADAPQGSFTLTVPTGGGKTLTALAFALAHARRHGLRRVIVVIPFTSIIEQTARVYRDALGPHAGAVLEHHSAFDATEELRDERIGPDRLRLSMATWDRPIVVTTAVQFFESLFASRPSRCRKLHAIAGSVVVLDEAQTMPLPLLRPCVAALQELVRNYRSSVVLCTATQPAVNAPSTRGAKDGFEGGLERPTELAPNVPALFAALRRTMVRSIGEQDDSALAARLAAQEQALCIVNQRAHARALFGAIRHLPGARHLSTCMHAVHRTRTLDAIRADLAAGSPCRVVSTSLVEAGVDVDFPLVLRAEAGLDQIAQAAGRCNREGRRSPDASEVLVFGAAEYGVIQELRPNAEAGREMLGLHPHPFEPTAMRAYFQMLYWRRGKQALDKPGVLAMCRDKAASLDFPFETIAAAMRFIDDAMVPVIVPVQDDGVAHRLVDRLRHIPKPGGIVRELQRYTVGVPRRARAALVAGGVAEVIREAEFGDQFVVLRHLDLYRPDIGLDWTDPTFAEAEKLIVA